MIFKNSSFHSLPFSALFQTYISDFEKLSGFYEANPFSDASIQNWAHQFNFSGDRKKTVNYLLQFNRSLGVGENAINNIERLNGDDAMALVTGQQLGIFGGPLYTFFKTIAVIHLSRQHEKKLKRPVIPVFWLADEDHDYEEVQSLNILTRDGFEEFSLPENHSTLPVSDITFPEQIDELKKQLRTSLIDTDFSDELWQLLDTCFQPGQTFLNGFGTFIGRLFSKHGLVLAGSNNKAVKEVTKEILIQSVQQANEVDKALNETSEELGGAFHQQVTLNDSHLFYLSRENGRQKISRTKNKWHTDYGKEWSTDELAKEITNEPAKFSPDVFLRPIVQDRLLPTLGYIGGPGEIAYYGQMKSMYPVFDMKMPVIFPRLSATFIEPAIDRILQELPFKIYEYENRIEDLEKAYVKQTEDLNIDAAFEKWKEGIEDLEAYYSQLIGEIDESLLGTSKKAQTHYANQLDQLKGKTYGALKKNESIQIKRIHRIQENLFPNRVLQERTLSGIYYMNKFGLDIWDNLLENLDDELNLKQHKLIYL